MHKIWPAFALGQIYLQFALGGEPPPLRVVLKNLGFLLRTFPVAERKAIHHLEQAIALAKASNTGSVLLQANLGLGQLHLKKKRWAKARTHLEEAITFATENGNTVVLEKARAALAQLEGKGK
ncbi:MAG: hypothetical protein OEW39_13620 [Deltaproteobacteria bacterium]|nr:hypothetical protein [Deltaproteobacteria bacterium]